LITGKESEISTESVSLFGGDDPFGLDVDFVKICEISCDHALFEKAWWVIGFGFEVDGSRFFSRYCLRIKRDTPVRLGNEDKAALLVEVISVCPFLGN
jgi:hypothetical protein